MGAGRSTNKKSEAQTPLFSICITSLQSPANQQQYLPVQIIILEFDLEIILLAFFLGC